MKKVLNENKGLLIVLLLVIIGAMGIYFYNKKSEKDSQFEYNKENIKVNFITKNYKVNEYANVNVDLLDLLNEYYRYYINLQLNDSSKAYDLLNKTSKERFHNNLDEYNEYLKTANTVALKTATIKEYRKSKVYENGYDIIDTAGNRYVIIENAIWDINIYLGGKA